MWKVLWAEAKKTPELIIHGLQLELVGHVSVFVAQSVEIALFVSRFPITLRQTVFFEQSGLPHEDGFNLKDIIAVVSHLVKRYVERPLLECVTVSAESEVGAPM